MFRAGWRGARWLPASSGRPCVGSAASTGPAEGLSRRWPLTVTRHRCRSHGTSTASPGVGPHWSRDGSQPPRGQPSLGPAGCHCCARGQAGPLSFCFSVPTSTVSAICSPKAGSTSYGAPRAPGAAAQKPTPASLPSPRPPSGCQDTLVQAPGAEQRGFSSVLCHLRSIRSALSSSLGFTIQVPKPEAPANDELGRPRRPSFRPAKPCDDSFPRCGPRPACS